MKHLRDSYSQVLKCIVTVLDWSFEVCPENMIIESLHCYWYTKLNGVFFFNL